MLNFLREKICFENKLPVECHMIYAGWNLIPFSTAQSSLRTLWTGLYDEFVSTVVRGGFKLKWRGFENHRKYIRFVVASPTTFFFSTLCCLFKVFSLVEFYSKGSSKKVLTWVKTLYRPSLSTNFLLTAALERLQAFLDLRC